MASTYNRGSKNKPNWYGRIKVGGRWTAIPTHQTTKAAADRVAADTEAKVHRHLLAHPSDGGLEEREIIRRALHIDTPKVESRMTVTGLAEQFLKEYSSERIHDLAKYRQTARTVFQGRILPHLGNLELGKARKADVLAWVTSLREEGYQNNSINQALVFLNVLFNWAVVAELMPNNPAFGVKRFKAHVSEDHYSLQEVHRLLSLEDLLIDIRCALYTGMRRGELCGLTWDCAFLDSQIPYIEVRRNYRGPTKNRRPRAVPVHPELLPFLRRWRERCPKTDEGLVFPVQSWAGPAKQRRPIWRMATRGDPGDVREILERAKVRTDFMHPWHAFRHTLATRFMECTGGNEDALSKILGHSQGPHHLRVTPGYIHTGLKYLYEELCKVTLLPPSPEGIIRLDEHARKQGATTR